jgi:glucose/arabinose dehydrogenase
MAVNLGKILRLNDDGSVPADNPSPARGGVTGAGLVAGPSQSARHRLGREGQLWEIEMGPPAGDELNLNRARQELRLAGGFQRRHYDGSPIPDHDTAPQFEAPKLSWNPVIAPADLISTKASVFPDWKGNALIAGPEVGRRWCAWRSTRTTTAQEVGALQHGHAHPRSRAGTGPATCGCSRTAAAGRPAAPGPGGETR